MTLCLLVIAYLVTLYLVAMLVLWHCLREQKQESIAGAEVRFALKEGQTIVGVGYTTEAVYCYFGDDVMDGKNYE